MGYWAIEARSSAKNPVQRILDQGAGEAYYRVQQDGEIVMGGLIAELGRLLREYAEMMRQLWAEIRLLINQSIRPHFHNFGNSIHRALRELGRRHVADAWMARSFNTGTTAAGLPERTITRAMARGVLRYALGVSAVMVAVYLAVGIVAPLALSIYLDRKAAKAPPPPQQRGIFESGGAYPGLDARQLETPRRSIPPSQAGAVSDLSRGNVDERSLIPTWKDALGVGESRAHSARGDSSAETRIVRPNPALEGTATRRTGHLDEAALQADRMRAMSQDIAEYNRLIKEHRALYREFDIDPCMSGFFPQGCSE